jgi:lipopolysaccharide export system permease protein
MNLLELRDYIRKVESEGYDATRYAVDYQAKLAFPFVCIIMALFATGLTLRTRIYESVPMSIVYGLVSAFLYWVVYSFCLSLGKSGMLPPFIAAWVTNLIFVSIGSYALLEAE